MQAPFVCNRGCLPIDLKSSGAMNIKEIDFLGWKNCIELTNGIVRMVVTTQVGPRIIHLSFIDGDNLLYQDSETLGSTGGDDFHLYGGHRFWCAPEILETTYVPDNFPVKTEVSGEVVRFIAPIEKSGIEKTIEISLDHSVAKATVNHILMNRGNQTLTLAPWGLTMMKPGGTAILPHSLDRLEQFPPTHMLALWSYSRMADPRWTWGDRFILLRQDPTAGTPQKVGVQIEYGWAAYAVDGQLFVKKINWNDGAVTPDYSCNFEIFTNKKFLELETLGPTSTLIPGATVAHQETWELHKNVPLPNSEADVEQWIMPLI